MLLPGSNSQRLPINEGGPHNISGRSIRILATSNATLHRLIVIAL
jgi:hypothetical protein